MDHSDYVPSLWNWQNVAYYHTSRMHSARSQPQCSPSHPPGLSDSIIQVSQFTHCLKLAFGMTSLSTMTPPEKCWAPYFCKANQISQSSTLGSDSWGKPSVTFNFFFSRPRNLKPTSTDVIEGIQTRQVLFLLWSQSVSDAQSLYLIDNAASFICREKQTFCGGIQRWLNLPVDRNYSQEKKM